MSRPSPVAGGAPSAEVLAAFGASAAPVLLDGGQRRTWRSGDLVLKPVEGPDQHAWTCEVLDSWPAHDVVRVPRPLRSPDGGWAAHGWSAHHWVPGRTVRAGEDPSTFRQTVQAFHEVVAGLERPGFLDHRDDVWAVGDRVAWDGRAPDGSGPTRGLLAEALAALAPVTAPAQVLHGDVGGNVLRSPGLPDAVIDWPVYFRPAGFALAVVAGDAIAWEGAGESLLDAWGDQPEWDQLLLRAVVYRLATRGAMEARGEAAAGDAGYGASRRPSLEMVLRRVERGR